MPTYPEQRGFSDWSALRTTPSDRRGEVDDTPATAFQYCMAMDFEVSPDSVDPPSGQAHFEIEIVDAGNTVLFHQKVQFRYSWAIMGAPGSPIYGWVLLISMPQDPDNTSDGNTSVVTTDIPETFETIGGEQPYAFFDTMTGFFVGSGNCMWEYYSAPYLIPLPAGAKLRVRRANIGLVDLKYSGASISTSVKQGAAQDFHRLKQDGMHRVAMVQPGVGLVWKASCDVRGMGGVGAWPISDAPAPTEPQTYGVIYASTAAQSPYIAYHQLVPTVFFQVGAKLMVSRSENDGAFWGEPMELASNLSVIGMTETPEGGTFWMVITRAGIPLALVAMLQRDDQNKQVIRVMEEYPTVGLPKSLPTGSRLRYLDGTFILTCTISNRLTVFQSTDNLRTWQ